MHPSAWHHLQVHQESPTPQDSRKKLRGQGESWQGSSWSILMKKSQKLPKNAPSDLTPSPISSGTSMSSITPGRDLENRWSLDWVHDVQILWKFYESLQRMLLPIWHHLQVHQEPPCPSWLKEETKRKGRVFTGFWCPISMKILLKLLKDSSSY